MNAIRVMLAAALLISVSAVSAQDKKKKGDQSNDTRTLQGIVTTDNDMPVQGAVVQLKNTKTLQIRSFITQQNGNYYFNALSTDVDYEVKAESGGASSPTKTLSSFDSRKEATLNLKLNKK